MMENTQGNSRYDTISYMDLIQMVLARQKTLIITVLIFLSGGILIAITSPIEFESSAITISESQESGISGLGQLGGLAGMAGINIPNANSSTFSPDMYSDVISSRSFLHGLIDEEFFFETKGRTMSLKEYYLTERPGNIISKSFNFIVNSPTRFINLFKSSEQGIQGDTTTGPLPEETVLRVVSTDEYVISQLRKRINIDNDKRLITLRVKAPEPLISAQLNVIVLNRLISYATEYKTEKQRINLEFIEDRTMEAEENFKKSQLALASFRDSNQGIITQKARTREEFLQAEFNIAFNVYNTLKQEEEQTRIQLKKETPIFTTFEPPVVPLGKAEPKPGFILIISIFLGLFVGLGIVVVSIIIAFFKNSLNKV